MSTPKLTPATVHAAICEPVAAYLAAQARAEVLTEQVDAIKVALLAERTYLDDDGARITHPGDAWTMSDAAAAEFYPELERRTNAAIPHDFGEGHCPALHAQSDMRDAGSVLLAAMAPLFGFNADRVYSLDLRRKMIDNGIRLVLAHEREQAAA